MRNIIISTLGVILIVLLIIFNYKTTSYFKDKNKIDNELQNLKRYELQLNYEILKITNKAYTNLDDIHQTELKIDETLQNLESSNDIQENSILYNFLSP